MAYGLEIYKSNGTLAFSSADTNWMQIDNFTVAANATVVKSYPDTTGFTLMVQKQMVDQPPGSQEHYAPEVTISGTTVTIAPYSGLSSEECLCLVLAQDQ